MITRLGLVSGEILELLDTMKEPVHIDNFKEHVDVPGDVILMSLGWLIREGYVYLLPHATGVEVRRNGISWDNRGGGCGIGNETHEMHEA